MIYIDILTYEFAGKVLTVNATEDGVEWTTVSAQAGEIVPTP